MHRRIQKMLRTPKSNIHSIDRGRVVNEQRNRGCQLSSCLSPALVKNSTHPHADSAYPLSHEVPEPPLCPRVCWALHGNSMRPSQRSPRALNPAQISPHLYIQSGHKPFPDKAGNQTWVGAILTQEFACIHFWMSTISISLNKPCLPSCTLFMSLLWIHLSHQDRNLV